MLQALGGPGTTIFTGINANIDNFRKHNTGYAIMHFAGHGLSLPTQGDLSALILATSDADGQLIDGYLRAHEIAATPIDAPLVVLSSCKSAVGQYMRGEGFYGLPQSFLEAGANGVVAGLWNLQDEAAWVFMGEFYKQLLKKGLAPADALRKAQNSLRQSPDYDNPYFWAGYKYQGDWQALQRTDAP